jgi:hypothetical protein
MRVACIDFGSSVNINPFAEACVRFSPQICLRSDEAVFIEIGKCKTLYREETFLMRVHILLKRFDLTAKVSIADNIVLALVQTRLGTNDLERLPLSALVYFSDPFLFSENDRKLIDKMVESFRRLGVKTLGDFTSIAASELPSRFGALGILCRQRLNDSSHIAWPAWSPPEQMEEFLHLAYDDHCGSIEPLLFKSKVILDRLFARLRGRGLRLSRVKIELKLENVSFMKKQTREFDFDFMMPQGSTMSILPIIRERFDREFSKNPLETLVMGMKFLVSETSIGYEMQSNLFHNREQSSEAVNAVMAHISELLGKGKVFHPVLVEERLPEVSWKKRDHDKEQSADLSILPLRPITVCPKPIKVQVTREMIHMKKKSFKIITWSEVERISDHWLDGEIERNYYRVTIENGPDLWIFKTKADEHYLHGWY